jgi:hypothetical protein
MSKWHKYFALERDSSQDDDHTDWPGMVTTELKFQEVATLLCASYSQGANKVTAAGISHGTCHKVLIT